MTNNTPNSKFDEIIKDVLKDQEASFDSSDWSRMNSMLDAAPKANTFNYKYIVNAAIVVSVCVGGYFIYSVFSSKTNSFPEKSEIINEKVEQPETIKEEPSTPIESILSSSEQDAEQPIKEEEMIVPTIVKSEEVVKNNKEKEVITKKEKAIKSSTKEEENIKVHPVIEMGNEPIFGDMIDSSKGIIGNTKEKDETKKAAKSTSTPIGWNDFMLGNVNPDSIRKHREKAKNDTLKK